MADIKNLIPFILKWEGGFANDPTDRGGATNKGVTIASYEAYCKKKGLPRPSVADLKHISDAHWRDIIKTMFWDKWRADDIHSQKIANILVDWVWMSGYGTIKKIQSLFGLTADGIVGNKTLSYINSNNQEEVFNKIWNRRKSFYESLVKNNPSQKVFLKGWMNRLNTFKFQG